MTASLSSSSDMASISGPVTASEYCSSTRPSMWPMAVAVSLWSPVIMATRTPARLASAMAWTHSGRGGSMMAQRPTKVSQGWSRPLTNSGPRFWSWVTSSLGMAPRVRPMTRRPCDERVAICSVQYFSSMSSTSSGLREPPLACLLHTLSMRSGAPFAWTMSLPSYPSPSMSTEGSWTVAINLYSDEKGTSATMGLSFLSSSMSTPVM
mmetsp:Transcript_29854/g.87122  ORF Transcript_29854/g.87122 Transcript_29854/m.87122 type:complete len:208 (-) Transcript_29854:1699-2322(-)